MSIALQKRRNDAAILISVLARLHGASLAANKLQSMDSGLICNEPDSLLGARKSDSQGFALSGSRAEPWPLIDRNQQPSVQPVRYQPPG